MNYLENQGISGETSKIICSSSDNPICWNKECNEARTGSTDESSGDNHREWFADFNGNKTACRPICINNFNNNFEAGYVNEVGINEKADCNNNHPGIHTSAPGPSPSDRGGEGKDNWFKSHSTLLIVIGIVGGLFVLIALCMFGRF